MAAPLTNGRTSSSSTSVSANPSSLFSKPTKLTLHDQLDPLQSLMPMPELPNLAQPPETPTKVEEILKMMTKQLVEGPPLSKIAATPRTEIEVQQPNKKHVYAELPPSMFKPPLRPRKFHRSDGLLYIYIHMCSIQFNRSNLYDFARRHSILFVCAILFRIIAQL